MYIYIYIYTHIHTYKHVYIYIYVYTCITLCIIIEAVEQYSLQPYHGEWRFGRTTCQCFAVTMLS